jgi:hypothetical protein
MTHQLLYVAKFYDISVKSCLSRTYYQEDKISSLTTATMMTPLSEKRYDNHPNSPYRTNSYFWANFSLKLNFCVVGCS